MFPMNRQFPHKPTTTTINGIRDRGVYFDGVSVISITLRVQVPNNHIPTPNLYHNYYYPKPKYPIIGYLDPLGNQGAKESNRVPAAAACQRVCETQANHACRLGL